MALYRPTYIDPKTNKRKQSAVWWFEFTYAGKRVRESAKTKRKTIATEVEKRRHLEMERALAGVPIEDPGRRIHSVSDSPRAYQAGYGVNHRPKSVAWVAERSAHVERLLGSAMASDVTEDRVRGYMETRLSEGAGNRTVNMELECLARSMGRTWCEVWPKAKRLEEPDDIGRALSSEEERALLDAAVRNRSRFIHPFMRIALLTAMRSSEIRTLRWTQIDLNTRTITVGTAKTAAGRGRIIPLNEALYQTLAQYADWYTGQMGERKPQWYLFPFSNRTRPTDPTRPATTIKTAWESVRRAANVRCRFHDLRHTTLTKMAEAGVPESTMLALAGHMSRAMLERYSHIRMKAKRTAMDSLTLHDGSSNAVPKESPKVDDSVRTAPKVN
jgi:integrase